MARLDMKFYLVTWNYGNKLVEPSAKALFLDVGLRLCLFIFFMFQLKALGIDNILGFDWPASPSPESMIRALEILYSLEVLDDDAKLTSPVGFHVAEIPLVWISFCISSIRAACPIDGWYTYMIITSLTSRCLFVLIQKIMDSWILIKW